MTFPCLFSLLTEFQESTNCSQDSMREDSFVSSTGPDQFSETAVFSGSDSETQDPTMPSQELEDQPPISPLSDSEPPPTSLELPSSDENQTMEAHDAVSNELHLDTDMISTVSKPVESVEEVHTTEECSEPVQEKKDAKTSEKSNSDPSVHQATHRSSSILSRADSLSVSVQ